MAVKVLNWMKSASVLSLEIVVSILLSIVIAPIGLTFAFLNEIVRVIVSTALKIHNNGNGGRNRITLVNEGADNIWAYKKPNNGRICLALLFCENPIDITQHRKLYLSRVINYTTKHGRKPYEKMRKILTFRYGYHCHQHDDSFDIHNHVKVWPGTEKPEVIVNEDQLMNEILPELFKDMDESKPQWEEVIIPRFFWESKDTNSRNAPFNGGSTVTSVRIFRYHHGFMDGASNLLLWTACMTDDQGASFPFPVNPLVDSGKVSKFERFLYDLSCVILGAFTMAKSVISASRLRSRYVTTEYSGKRHFGWSEPLDVELLRKIKNTYKSSVPSMLATALGGAFRKLDEKYPNATYGNPEEVAIGLVSALVPYPNHDLRNQFTVVHFPVNTGSQPDKQMEEKSCKGLTDKQTNLQRLQITSQNMTKIGRDPMVYLNYFMFKYFGRFPAALVQAMMENGGLPVVFSNVPMSTEIVEFWGNPVVGAAGWPPLLTNTGLGIVTMRYAKHMRFCAVADEACLSPEALNYFLKEVATELQNLAEECSDFETVIHKSDNRNDNSIMMMASNGNNVAYNSYINPKTMSISTTVVTMDFRRGSVPSQIIDTIDD